MQPKIYIYDILENNRKGELLAEKLELILKTPPQCNL